MIIQRLDKMIERSRGLLETEIMHTNGIFKLVNLSWDAVKVTSWWELIDCDQGDDLTSGAD